jgi:hypothetical protein
LAHNLLLHYDLPNHSHALVGALIISQSAIPVFIGGPAVSPRDCLNAQEILFDASKPQEA